VLVVELRSGIGQIPDHAWVGIRYPLPASGTERADPMSGPDTPSGPVALPARPLRGQVGQGSVDQLGVEPLGHDVVSAATEAPG
jgi:hypothetical protein